MNNWHTSSLSSAGFWLKRRNSPPRCLFPPLARPTCRPHREHRPASAARCPDGGKREETGHTSSPTNSQHLFNRPIIHYPFIFWKTGGMNHSFKVWKTPWGHDLTGSLNTHNNRTFSIIQNDWVIRYSPSIKSYCNLELCYYLFFIVE